MDMRKQSEGLVFLEHFKQLLEGDIDYQEIEKFIQFAQKNADTNQEEIAQIAQVLADKGYYRYSIQALESVVALGCIADIWEKFIKIIFKSGLIEKANLYTNEYLHYLYEKKSFSRGLNFISACKELGIDHKLVNLFELYFFLQQGNIKALEKNISKISRERTTYQNEFFSSIFKELCNYYSSWKESLMMVKYFIENSKDFIGKKNNFEVDELFRITFIKSLYRYIVLENKIDNNLGISIGNYSLIFSKKELGICATKYVDKLKTRNYFFEKLYAIDDPDERKEDKGHDLAQDLFEDEEKDISYQEKLEKNAQFFLEIDIRKAEKFIRQLEDINPNHPSVKQYYILLKQELKEQKSERIKGSIADIKERILKEIRVYTKKEIEKNKDVMELPQEITDRFTDTTNKTYRDIVCHLYYIGQFDQAIDFLKKIEGESESIIEVNYLIIILYMEARNYACALEVLDESITSLPLEKDEALCFYYLKGECYYQMQEEKNALDIFKNIKYYNKNYRLTNQRLKFLEQSK